MDTVRCGTCGADLGPIARRKAFLSIFVLGDEETRSWYFCEACRVWMIQEYLDRFLGGDSVALRGPYPEAACREEVALVRTCPEPGNKWCECPAHQRFGH
jgi:hypothetical protein